MSGPEAPARVPRGTLVQRARVCALRAASAVLTWLPTGVVGAGADAVGELWYRATPGRAAMGRANLGRVCANLAATGRATPRVRRAATDSDELERLLRAAYRHAARTYLELLRRPAIVRELWGRLTVEHPETVEPAFARGPAILGTMHFGSLQVIAEVLIALARAPVTAPMETLGDPELQSFMTESRAAPGLNLVGLSEARRELKRALERGELAGAVADRDIAGGGIPTSLFGSMAPMPPGLAMLALECNVPIHVAAVRRLRGGRYAGHLVTIEPAAVVAAAGATTRRQRVEAVLTAEVAAFEHFIAAAPEQWWAAFFPIWPDLEPAPRVRR